MRLISGLVLSVLGSVLCAMCQVPADVKTERLVTDDDIAVLRQDVQIERTEIITRNINFTKNIQRPPCGELVWADDFVGDGFHLSECGHGFEDLEIGLNVGPLLWIFFGGDGGQGVRVEVFDIVFELDGD